MSILKPAVIHLSPAAGDINRVRRPVVVATSNGAVHLQAKTENDQKPHSLKSLGTSRRDFITSLTAASLAGATLFSPEKVEARTVKPENRKKIMEKLQQQREKGGGSSSKTGEKKDKKLPSPLQHSHKKPIVDLVEATLPS